MLEKTFELHPEVYKYSHSAHSQPNFHYYADLVIKFCEGTEQGDPESLALFSDSIQDLKDSLESKLNGSLNKSIILKSPVTIFEFLNSCPTLWVVVSRYL